MTISLGATLPGEADAVTARRRLAHRVDIQGLRAVAVSSVVLYHLWPNRLPAGYVGVDVFFVISGFLITLHLLQAQPASARDLGAFWVRRIRRILPAALFVLCIVLVATRVLAPDYRWRSTAIETLASALYVQNWHLSGREVDYLRPRFTPSPLQHYWSLSVEEQFYIVWPCLILAAVLLARHARRRLDGVVLGIFTVVVLASIAYSVSLPATNPAAFFGTPGRAWEFGIGGILAAVATRQRSVGTKRWRRMSGHGVRAALAWTGCACIAAAALLVAARLGLPGRPTHLAALGAAFVIAAHATGASSPLRFLALPPVRYLGDISYSVYLWHWPLLALAGDMRETALGQREKMAILVASLALGALTKRYVEDPFRAPTRRTWLMRPCGIALVGTSLVAVGATAQLAEVKRLESAAVTRTHEAMQGPCFGAAAMAPGNRCGAAGVEPPPSTILAATDSPDTDSDGCQMQLPWATLVRCVYGDQTSDVSVALVGNSHASHWLPALQEIAARNRWKITTFVASACYATSSEIPFATAQMRDNCVRWGREVMDATSGRQFDVVVTSELTFDPSVPDNLTNNNIWMQGYGTAKSGYDEYIREWLGRDVNLVVVRDTPYPGTTVTSVPGCLAHRADLDACSAPTSAWLRQDPLAEAAQEVGSPNATVADLSAYFCTSSCRSVIGGSIVYFDAHHISATYSRSLAPYLAPFIERALAR